MAVPYYPDRRSGETLFGTHSSDAAEAAREEVEAAESCVREHPESAIWTAFGTGLFIGAALGWLIASRRTHSWQSELSDLADRLRSRLDLD